MGQGFLHQLPMLENSILHPYVKHVACDDVTISRALLLYEIAFILLDSDRNSKDSIIIVKHAIIQKHN